MSNMCVGKSNGSQTKQKMHVMREENYIITIVLSSNDVNG